MGCGKDEDAFAHLIGMRKVLFVLLALFLLNSVMVILAQNDNPILELPGKIAYIGEDRNVYTLALHSQDPFALTDDATQQRRYQWPTWSDDGRLAYFCCEPNARGSVMDVFVSADGESAGEQIYSGESETFTYAYWAPSNCADGETCRDLGVLVSQLVAGTFSVELIRDGVGTTYESGETQRVGLAAPFYFSWSPDGTHMLLQRFNSRFELYDVASEEREQLPEVVGSIQAPAWSPVDDRLLIGVRNPDGETTDLVIVANNEPVILVQNLPGLVSYSWSPNGDYIAYRAAAANGVSSVYVVDSVTGERIAQSAVEQVFAFFWAPNSKMVAYATLDSTGGSFSAENMPDTVFVSSPAQQQNNGLSWGVVDISTGTNRIYGAFQPTTEMIYLLNFFDQFAQSHQVWSPDSTHVVYSEVTPEGNGVISILDMTRPDTVPLFIANGVIGIWSYN